MTPDCHLLATCLSLLNISLHRQVLWKGLASLAISNDIYRKGLLWQLQNVFVQIAKKYLSKLQNVFVQITECICQSYKMFLSQLQSVSVKNYCDNYKILFVQISERICQSYKMFLSNICLLFWSNYFYVFVSYVHARHTLIHLYLFRITKNLCTNDKGIFPEYKRSLSELQNVQMRCSEFVLPQHTDLREVIFSLSDTH